VGFPFAKVDHQNHEKHVSCCVILVVVMRTYHRWEAGFLEGNSYLPHHKAATSSISASL
jgi:hypothetical protein